MATPIRPEDLLPVPALAADDALIVDTGSGVFRTTPAEIADAGGAVISSELAASGGSNLVGFLQSGTGAVSRTAQDKLREQPITPEDFRELGDTDTQAMLKWAAEMKVRALAGLRPVGRVDNAYVISETMFFSDMTDFAIIGNGSVTMANGTPVNYGYSAFAFTKCSRFLLQGIAFDGNRAGRAPAEADAHTVNIYSSNNFTIRDVRSINAVCDGFMIQAQNDVGPELDCYRFLIENCFADNCYRQGMSITQGREGIVAYCQFNGSNGVAPEAGVDVEAFGIDPDGTCRDILFIGCSFRNNAGRGLEISNIANPRNIRVVDCDFYNNADGAIYAGMNGGCIVRPFISGHAETALVGAITVPADDNAGFFDIVEPVFRNTTGAGKPLIVIQAGAGGYVNVTGLDVDTCGLIAGIHAPNCRFLNARRIVADQSTAGGQFYVTGADCEISGSLITNFYEAAIFVDTTAARFVCRRNTLLEPDVHSGTQGCIRITTVGAIVEGNHIRRAASAAGIGIYIDLAAEQLERNNITGFTGSPYTLIVAPTFNRGNIANGTKQAETVIT